MFSEPSSSATTARGGGGQDSSLPVSVCSFPREGRESELVDAGVRLLVISGDVSSALLLRVLPPPLPAPPALPRACWSWNSPAITSQMLGT